MAHSDAPNGAWNVPAIPAAVEVAYAPHPPRAPRQPLARLRLNTMSDLAKEHRKLYREARAGVISASEATKLAYLLATLANLMTTTEFEERLAALERQE